MTDVDTPKNEHLRSYISYYNNLKAPKYAVLVKGEWGVGKTHLINDILKEDQRFYISLFGLTTIQEVHSSLFVKMYPNRSRMRKLLNWFGNSSLKASDLTLTFGSLIGNIANAVIKEKVDNSKPIVFDDLERCTIKPEDLFGAINNYVEHHGCKVIVIAHDEKINKRLTDKKEKIFGQVIKVSPDIKDAFEHFIKTSKIPTAFGIIKDVVYKSFLASECKSLRVLDYVINDCARLLACIPRHITKNKEALFEVFTLFSALNINYRLGILKENHISQRDSIIYFANKDKQLRNVLDEIKENYKKNEVPLEITSNILSNKVLTETIVNGLYNEVEILNCIENSRYFIKAESRGPWYTIMNFDSIETEKVDIAIEDLNKKFANLEITEKGEILHSVNLLFMLSEINHIKKSIHEIYIFFLDYIKKLQDNNIFPSASLFNEYEPFNDSAYGYGFWIKDSYKHYSAKMSKILEHQEKIALRKKYSSYLIDLKQNLKEDTSKFCDKISRNGIREVNTFGYVDIMASFKPYQFVDIWLSTEIANWRKIQAALVNRYSAGSLRNELANEVIWLKNVNMNLRHRASKASGIDRLRISRLLIKP